MRLTVYCGASRGVDPVYGEAAEKLGAWMASSGIPLVFGGGRIGLMGILADAVLAGGGQATGVIPRFLADREVAHSGLTALITVETMAERKAKMLAIGDAYLALPGGPGTLEEISEAFSARRLGLHKKPCLIYNVSGCYDGLETCFDDMEKNGFLSSRDRGAIHFCRSIEDIGRQLSLRK